MGFSNLRQSVIDYCSFIGGDPMLVQGAGGNVSWKDGNVLWVKASGTWLKDALNEEIFVPVDLSALKHNLNNDDFFSTPKVIRPSALRPSIETMLHALLPHSVVVHLHAIDVLTWMVRVNADIILKEMLIDLPYSWCFVPYRKPGGILAREVSNAISNNPYADVFFMSNHGVVIGGNSVFDVNNKLKALLQKLKTEPLQIVHSEPPLLNSFKGQISGYNKIDDVQINQLALDKRLYERLSCDWAIYPDHIVFLGPEPYLISSDCDNIENAIRFLGEPSIIFFENVGVFSRGRLDASKMAQLRCYYDVISRQIDCHYLSKLSSQDILDIIRWDAEKYRQSISKSLV